MHTLMDTSPKVTTFFFTSKFSSINGFLQIQEIDYFDIEGSWLMYGGKTNYIQGAGTQATVLIDWTADVKNSFGFMMTWSPNALCRT